MKYLELAIKASLEAGEKIMEVYGTSFDVEIKDDNSPLTVADKKSHEVIMNYLSSTGIPVLSEEGKSIPYEERSQWDRFWLVDPLDGTKEFIKRNGDFTVNIALIEGQEPVLGVIYAPVPGQLYFASREIGAYIYPGNSPVPENLDSLIARSDRMSVRGQKEPYVVVASRSHFSPETEAFVEKLRAGYPDLAFASKGSSLKLCLVAEGEANIYPRLGPTMEWDTAAGHAIVECAGGTVTEFHSGQPLKYNKSELLNPWFIAK